MTDTIKSLTEYRDWLLQENADLIERYGTGVRPSWVSTDLSINAHRANMAQERIDELEAQK